ncbi:hypothetical protein KAS50_05670 [bacterium]|nr:hypothetical protein [bacterium]
MRTYSLMKPIFAFLVLFIWLNILHFNCAEKGISRIQVFAENSRYWEYKGKPVLLLSGSDDDNLFNSPDLMTKNFAILEKIGGNYIRSTLSSRDEGNASPYIKKNGKYNLEKFNTEFWKRLKNSIIEAKKRDIIVQIEIWATWDFYRDNWLENHFNPKNNINYTTENTMLETKVDIPNYRKAQSFFYSIPKINNNKVLLKYQEAFVKKVLDVTYRYPNVLYCLDNETQAPSEWALYWGDFIKRYSEKKGVKIQLTGMFDYHNIKDPRHGTTYKHPEYFSFTEVSQNTTQVGQTHYDNLIWYRENLVKEKSGICPMNNVKVYSHLWRPDKRWSDKESIDRWWRNIFAGCASTRFHRHVSPVPDFGIGLDETAQIHIRAGRVFTSAFNVFTCEPKPELLSEREENEAYCLAEPGKVYAVFFPDGGEVNLLVESGNYRVRWFDIKTAAFREAVEVSGKHVELKSPGTGDVQLVLVEKE